MTHATSGRDAPTRRLLLTCAVLEHSHDASLNRPGFADDVRRVRQFFDEFGYEHVPAIGDSPTADQLRHSLRDFAMDPERRPDDYVVVYVASHGEILDGGPAGSDLALLMSDVDPEDPRIGSVRSGELAELLLADTRVHRLLLIIDACYSGEAAFGATRAATTYRGNRTGIDSARRGYGVMVIGSTLPEQFAVQGVFTRALLDALKALKKRRGGAAGIELDDILEELAVLMPPSQFPALGDFRPQGVIKPQFLSEPAPASLPSDLTHAGQRELRVADMERLLVHIDEFVGRRAARAEIVSWLEDPADRSPMIVVGDPGSGKTSLLGWLAAVSDRRYTPMAPRDEHPEPKPGAIDLAIYAGGRTGAGILAGIAAAGRVIGFGPEAEPETAVTALLTGLAGRRHPLTVLIDALDEAFQPETLVRDVIIPLIDDGAEVVRLLLGARRQVLDWFEPSHTRNREIDLDSEHYVDHKSLRQVVLKKLFRGETEQGHEHAQTVVDVAGAIADVAKNSFFLGRLLAENQAGQPLPDPTDQNWLDSLPHNAGAEMYKDLMARFGAGTQRAVGLLLPLAYAQGAGLPWGEIWPALADALTAAGGYENRDLSRLRSNAGSYVVDAGLLADRRIYRLCHRSLADYLKRDRNEAEDERRIVKTLVATIPRREDGLPDWPKAHPYVRTHLVGHAVGSGDIDQLAQEPGFLLVTDPARLLPALDRTVTPPARVAANAYRRALPMLRGHPPSEHAAYLGLAARCARADRLADKIDVREPWRARWVSWQLQRPHVRIDTHADGINAVALATMDKRPVVVSGSDDGTIRLWDARTGAPLRKPISAHEDAVTSLVVAPLADQQVIVSGSTDRTVKVWDLATGSLIGRPFDGHTDRIRAVAVTTCEDTLIVVSAGEDKTLRVSELDTGMEAGPAMRGHEAPVGTVACGQLADVAFVVSGDDDGHVLTWDLRSRARIAKGEIHPRVVRGLALAELEDAPVAISGGDDASIRVWNPLTGTSAREPIGGHSHGDGVRAVTSAVLDDRPVVVSGSEQGTILVFDLATAEQVGDTLVGHTGAVRTVSFATLDDRPTVVSGGADGTVRIWDIGATAGVTDPFAGHNLAVQAVAETTLNGYPVVVSGGKDTTVRVWDLATGSAIREPYSGHSSTVTAVLPVTVAGRPAVISAEAVGIVQVWDLATHKPIGAPYRRHNDRVTCLALGEQAGDRVVISGCANGAVHVWSLAGRTDVGLPVILHNGWVRALAVARSGKRTVVLSASEDGTVRVWYLDDHSPAGPPYTGHNAGVMALAVVDSDDGTVVVSGDDGGVVRVWNLATRAELRVPFTEHTQAVRAIVVARLRERRVVLSGSKDGMARTWDLMSRAPVGAGSVHHSDWVRALAVGELEGKPVAISGTGDATIKVWEIESGTERFGRHSHWVRAVALGELANRAVVVSGSVDSTVRVWDLEHGQPIGRPMVGHSRGVRTVATTRLPDGRSIAVSGGDDSTIRIWDLRTGIPIGRPLAGHSDWVRAVVIGDRAGHRVVVSGGDTTVRIWRLLGEDQAEFVYHGHSAWVRSVAIGRLSDGRQVVVSAGVDTTVHVWDLESGARLGRPFTGHSQPVRTVAVTGVAGCTVVCSACDNGTVHVWDLESREPIGEPLRCEQIPIEAVVTTRSHRRNRATGELRIVVTMGEQVSIYHLSATGSWQRETTMNIGSDVLSAALLGRTSLILGSKLGIVTLDLPR